MLILATILLLSFVGIRVLNLFSRPPVGLGVNDGRLAECPDSPNCVSTQTQSASHSMQPIQFSGSVDAAIAKLKQVLAQMPRTKLVKESPGYLHFECRSLLFQYVDDVEFLVDEKSQQIHFRSASRIGRSDLGVNRNRMNKITEEFQK